MTSLYQIIKSLQDAKGSNAKQAILDANKDNELLKQYMKAVYDPAIVYYQKAVPKHGKPEKRQAGFDHMDIAHAIYTFAGRRVTGDLAKSAMRNWLEDQNSEEDQELCKLLIARKVGGNVGETMVLKTWPNLFFVPPYMRCSTMDAKVRKVYSEQDEFYVQKKHDGSFAYLRLDNLKVITRQGSIYPHWFSDRFYPTCVLGVNQFVLVGEMTVYEGGYLLPRKDGNGILNSVLQGAPESDFDAYTFVYTAWDCVTVWQFEKGSSDVPYEKRLLMLNALTEDLVKNVHTSVTTVVKSIAEANALHFALTAQGEEGTVWKLKHGHWRNSSSGTVDQVKNKVAFTAEYKIVGWEEGQGKAAGMIGKLNVATKDDLLTSGVGTGFTDKDRQDLWAIRDTLEGVIVQVTANDVIQSRDLSQKPSLSLPVFDEIRFDRTEADTYDRVIEQLTAAKEGR